MQGLISLRIQTSPCHIHFSPITIFRNLLHLVKTFDEHLYYIRRATDKGWFEIKLKIRIIVIALENVDESSSVARNGKSKFSGAFLLGGGKCEKCNGRKDGRNTGE